MASSQFTAGAAPDPQAVQRLWFSFAPACVLKAAVQLNVFAHLATGNRTAAEVGRASGATERGTRMLLDALTGLELLTKQDGGYDLAPLSAQYLVPDRPDYTGGVLESNFIMEPWLQLADVIRTGQVSHPLERQQEAERFFPTLVRSLHVMNRAAARRLAAGLSAGTGAAGLRVLDVACGSGVWSIAIAEADAQVRVTAHDFPGVLDTTREYLRRHGVEAQYDFIAGDLKEVDFGEGRFDVAVLGNVLHTEGETSSRSVLQRIHRALKPGGRAVIIDMVPNDDRSGPLFPLLFALNMLVHSSEGDTFTLPEYLEWLKDAGFHNVETVDIGSPSPAIIAKRG